MTPTEIIEALRSKLAVTAGRHLYGVLGTYAGLEDFAIQLRQATTRDGQLFPAPVNVSRGLLAAIPDGEFKELAANEAKRPEPAAKHVERAFEKFLRDHLVAEQVLILQGLELLSAYGVEWRPLRALAANENKVLLLLPGCRSGGRVTLYHEAHGLTGGTYALPTNLIADNHLWELENSHGA